MSVRRGEAARHGFATAWLYKKKMRPTAIMISNARASRLEGRQAEVFALLSEQLKLETAEAPVGPQEERILLDRLATTGRVIVAGGDGTLHHLLPILLKANKPVGVLPLGTANDFAKSIGLPADLRAACDVASGSCVREVDVGMINGRPFLNVASLGVAATVSKMQSRERKRWLRVFSYALSLTQAVRRCRPFHAEIRAAGHPQFRGIVLQASIGNGRYHGGGLSSGPDARIDDNLLHVYTVAARRWWQLFPVVPALLFGLHGWTRGISSFDTTECTLTTRRPKRATVDGELLATKARRFHFYLLSRSLGVFTPASFPPGLQDGQVAPERPLSIGTS